MQTRSSSCDALYDTARCTRDRYWIVPADSCEDFPRPCALGWAGLAVASSLRRPACMQVAKIPLSFCQDPKEVLVELESNGFVWLTLIGQSIWFWPEGICFWFDFRGRSKDFMFVAAGSA